MVAISSAEFRGAMRLLPAGVTIVTSRISTPDGERRHGMTVSAFTSVSADPPLIAVIIDHTHTLNAFLELGSGFAVNVLDEQQRELSHRFAFEKDRDRFQVGNWTEAVTGAPVLDGALAWLDCRVESQHVAGSHTIHVGLVEAAGHREGAGPLIYWNRDYRRLDTE